MKILQTTNERNIMKTNRAKNWMAVWAAVLTATSAFHASADQSAAAAKPEESYTGTVVSVDPKESTLETKGLLLSRKFNLGKACSYLVPGKSDGGVGDLRPGEKVKVTYQNVNGVLVADRVEQIPMQFVGKVAAIDPATHTLTLHRPTMDKRMQIAGDCKIVLRDEKTGMLADIHPGNQVTVIYETPGGTATARQIAQTSLEFTGTLSAIDLGERTVKARATFDAKKFNVANDCAIIVSRDRIDGRLGDLKPNDNLMISYDEINGINVANRIALAKIAATNSIDAATAPT